MESIPPPADDAEWLRRENFVLVGHWLHPEAKLQRIERPPSTLSTPSTPAIYAFVVDGVVRYVGKATYLRSRLRGYNRAMRPGTPRKFRRVHKHLFGEWTRGKKIDIWACHHRLPDDGDLGAHERRLILDRCPAWNVQGLTADAEVPE